MSALQMSVPQFAARHQLSTQSVYAMVNHGKLGVASRKVDGRVMIDVESADRIMAMGAATRIKKKHAKLRNNPQLPGGVDEPGAPPLERPDNSDMDDASRLVKAQADEKEQLALLAELKVRQQQGLLVEREQVARDVFKIARTLRDGLLNVPGKVAPEIAAMDDPFQIQKRLESMFRDILTDLSAAVAKMGVGDEPV